jgi:serine/threonine-protein kinase 24/25/MST4
MEYSLVKLIGKGSFGKVYRAVKIHSGSVVAIKIMDLDTEEDDITSVRQELLLLSKCDSPFITKYHESILVGSKLWIVMDYAAGGSIRSLLQSGVIPESAISNILRQVLNALVYLQKVGIIHRDIKGQPV